MNNQLVKTMRDTNIENLLTSLIDKDTVFILFFYGADVDFNLLYDSLKMTDIAFMGCMDAGRLSDDSYYLAEKSIAGMSFSNRVFEKYAFGTVDMSPEASSDKIRDSSRRELQKACQGINLDLSNPDMKRDFIINLAYGLNSATPFLEGQTQAGMMLQSIGGSSGGKTDFITTNVMSHLGIGEIGAFGVFRLNKDFNYDMNRVSSFERQKGKILKATKLAGPRHVLEFNGKAAVNEYCSVLNISIDKLGPEIFADYTLGIEPGDEERLITSIMKNDDKSSGLLTYNDVREGTEFNLYKAVDQSIDRKKMLEKIKTKNLICYISFDCILCYLARNNLKHVEKIAELYGKCLPEVPKLGFGTFSENICGANVNQTETFIGIYRA
ncbi:MAG: FIST C-terminal domain-containing protein [Pseudomonadota bacterium]